jgi:hypothetical protein
MVVHKRNESGWKGLDVRIDKAVGVRFQETEYYFPERRISTDEHGEVRFSVLEGTAQLTFRVKAYRAGQRKITVPVQKLKKGFRWEIEERPVMAKAKVLFRTEEGVTEYNEKLKENLWPEADRVHASVYVWQAVYYRGSGRSRKRVQDTVWYMPALVENGRFDAEKSMLVFRKLKRGKSYVLGEKLIWQGAKMHKYDLLKGKRREFTVEKPGQSIGTIIAAINTYPLKVEVQNEDGAPLQDAKVYAERTDAQGAKRVFVGRTDEKGETDEELMWKGRHRITVQHPKLKFGRRDVEIPTNAHVTMRPKGVRKPTRGKLLLQVTDAVGNALHGHSRIALYRPRSRQPTARLAVSRNGMARANNLQPGRYLVVMHTFPEGAAPGAFAPEGLWITMKEIRVEAGRNMQHIRGSKGVKATLEVQNLPDVPQNADAIVSIIDEWWGVPYIAGRCMLGEGRRVDVNVPAEGRYWVCVAVPGPETEENQDLSDRFEGAVIYYSAPIRIQAGESSTVKIRPSTKHPARRGGLKPGDIPGFAATTVKE